MFDALPWRHKSVALLCAVFSRFESPCEVQPRSAFSADRRTDGAVRETPFLQPFRSPVSHYRCLISRLSRSDDNRELSLL